MNNESTDDFIEAVAIIGMVGRFADARNLEEFWQNLCDGVESIKFYSHDQLLASGTMQEKLTDPNWIRAAANVEGIDLLDAPFFGYNPLEAEVIDPQQRIFLECCWEALEKAAYTSDAYKGKIAVFAGTGSNWYKSHMGSYGDAFTVAIGNLEDYLATRVSYKLNLTGPSLTVQTACSTSLVATSLACQSLLTYQTDVALAGGVALSRLKGYHYEEGSIRSPDGHCRSFDAKAKGTVFGSGIGVVVLKRLSEAIADGDQIYAVVKGYAVNNDGISKIGYTAPGVDGQAQAVAEAIAMAGVDPETITYVESHGTATSLGDPIEIAALTKAFRAGTQKKGFCAVGSVKPNIGHTDAAAGVAGLMKTALCLKHEKIPASLNFEEPNPRIDFANSPFYVNTRLSEWKSNGSPRRAGVSSFGIGGTNAHVILEEAPPPRDSGPSRPWQLLLLSAKTGSALDAMTANLAEHLKTNPTTSLADAAYTLQVGRKVFDHQRMLVASSVEDAVNAFEQQDPRVIDNTHDLKRRSVVFMFSGQGAQHVQMACDLYQHEPTFRRHVDYCCEVIKPHLGIDLREVIYSQSDNDEATRLLNQTYITQPALFVIEYAMAKLWIEWGIQPEAMVGHSIGEYLAACLSGVFSLEDALMLVVQRGRVMQELPPGAMLSVSGSEAQVRSLLSEDLSLAAVNAPSLCVVSGENEAVAALEQRLAKEGIFCRRLHTSHAFHSEMMEPALAPFIEEVQKVTLNPPTIPYVSNVTGNWISAEEATDPQYWARHLRQTVRFSDAVVELLKDESRVFLEVGPGTTLQVLVKQHAQGDTEAIAIASLGRPKEQHSDLEVFLGSLGQLRLAGVEVDWDGFYARERRNRITLPTYPFERQRFWVARAKPNADSNEQAAQRGKKPDIADWFYIPSWKQSIPSAFLKRDESQAQQARWLVFMDECGLGSRIVEQLKRDGRDVIGVTIGEEFARRDDDTFALNPARQDDYVALLKQLGEIERTPSLIAHLWSVTPEGNEQSGIDSFDGMQDRCFFSLLFLAQALAAQNSKHPVQIGVVSNNMQDVTGGEDRFVEKATLLGACKVIPQEYADIGCISIDIGMPGSLRQQEQLVERLISELTVKSSDPVVAYRGNQRWVQTYDPIRLSDDAQGAVPLREGGVYLITGGMGGIGLVLAEHLARNARAKLVLITRSAFPAREEWQEYLDSPDGQSEVGSRILKVMALEEMGAEVLVFSADVANPEEMQEVIRKTREQFGSIQGVIHSAGVPAGGLIQLKTREMVSSIFAPKVRGAFILDSLLSGEKLDFFLLFSSLSSIIGGVGQVDYCAANAFLDAFAQSRSHRDDALTVAVGWDAWAEVGMAVKARKIWPKAPGNGSPTEKQQPQPNKGPGIHPLLDECVVEGDRQTYVTQFSPSKQWVLGQHKIQGYPTVVGTSYLEMARAAFEKHSNGGAVEIRDVIFMGPLVVDEGETKECHLVVKESGDDFEFVVKSKREAAGNEGPQWQEHVRGRIARANSEWPKRADLEEWREDKLTSVDSSRKKALEFPSTEAPQSAYKNPVTLGPRWRRAVESVIGRDRAWACFELADEFDSDLTELKLHPALMDSATSFALRMIDKVTLYLPFSYGRVKITAPLSKRIYSYARLREESAPDKGVVSFDIVITNDEGVELAEIEAFTMKKVGQVDIRGRARDGAVGVGSAPGVGKDRPSDADAILPTEGVAAFQRILSKNVPPEIIVSTAHLQTLIRHARASTSSAAVEKLDKKVQKTKTMHPRPSLKTPYAAPESDLEKDIAEVWQTVLGIGQIGVNDNFLELGGHSLIAIQIVHRLRDAYKINLPMDSVFKALTVAELAPVVLTTLTEQADEEMLVKLLDDIEQLTA